MVYHILNDEKFSDWVVLSFSKFNRYVNNEFFLISNNSSSKYFNEYPVKFVSKEFFLKDFKPTPNDIVIFYFLHLHSISFLLKFKKLKCKKIWVGYGADYYYYLLNSYNFQSLYLKNTLKIFNILNGYYYIKKLALIVYQKIFFQIKVLPALRTLTHFAPVIPNEFLLIKNKFPSLNFDYLEFTFGDLDFIGLNNEFVKGTDIILGNSATFACNHMDVLESLNHLYITNRIIIPISYGNPKYKKFLERHIPKNYSNFNIKLLSELLPIKEYNQILNRCGFAIMPHLRQQGMGNIYALLYSGTKLFLYKANPVYEFLKDLGIIFYSIEELISNPILLTTPLEPEKRNINRIIISKHYSKEKSLKRIQKIISL
jgi:hypothetical protein